MSALPDQIAQRGLDQADVDIQLGILVDLDDDVEVVGACVDLGELTRVLEQRRDPCSLASQLDARHDLRDLECVIDQIVHLLEAAAEDV